LSDHGGVIVRNFLELAEDWNRQYRATGAAAAH
jgi:hypothetical protein